MSVKKIILITALCISSVAYCEEASDSACLKFTQDCLLLSTNTEENCYRSAMLHPFCESTEIGSIIKSRINYSSGRLSAEGYPESIGSKIIDQHCLREFDTIMLNSKDAQIPMLKSKIVSCLKNANIDSY